MPWLKIVNEQTVFWVAIDGDLPYVVKYVVNSEFVVICTLMLFFDRFYLRETRFSGIEVPRKAGVVEQNRQNRKKQKKETRYKRP